MGIQTNELFLLVDPDGFIAPQIVNGRSELNMALAAGFVDASADSFLFDQTESRDAVRANSLAF